MSKAPLSSAVPFAVATIGIATFAGMDAIMKGLSIALGAYNALLWRTAIALLIAIVPALYQIPDLAARQQSGPVDHIETTAV